MKSTCPQCNQSYQVDASHVGRKLRCKECGTPLLVTAAGLERREPGASAERAQPFDFGSPAPAPRGDRPARREDKPAREEKPARRRPPVDEPDDEYDPRPRRRPAGGLGEYLAFRRMVVPVIIQVIFWVLTGLVVVAGLAFAGISIASGRSQDVLFGLLGLVVGVPLYILLIRIYCEIVIVLFRINDTLLDIKQELKDRGGN